MFGSLLGASFVLGRVCRPVVVPTLANIFRLANYLIFLRRRVWWNAWSYQIYGN